MTCHKDEEGDDLRDQLIKSYRGAVIPAFGTYRFTDKDNFKSVYWVIQMGIELQGLELILTELRGGVVKKADKVLRWLVANGHEELAALHATKSSAKDTMKRDANLVVNISTLSLAAARGWAPVIRALVTKGADINKAMNDGTTPLLIASQEGHVEVVRVLVEKGADINKAMNIG